MTHWCCARLYFMVWAGSEPTPVWRMVDHFSSITCRYFPSFDANAKSYSLVIEAKGCECLARDSYTTVPDRDSNPHLPNHKSNVLPLCHHDVRTSCLLFPSSAENWRPFCSGRRSSFPDAIWQCTVLYLRVHRSVLICHHVLAATNRFCWHCMVVLQQHCDNAT